MKVQILARSYHSKIGLSRYACSLLEAFQSIGFSIERVPPGESWIVQTMGRLLAPVGLDVQAFFLTYPVSATFARDALVHLPAQQMAALLWLKPQLHPVVVTVHDIVPYLVRSDSAQNTFRHPAECAFDWLAMQALNKADAIISVSNYTKKTLLEIGFQEEQVFVIHEGVESYLFKPLNLENSFYDRYNLSPKMRYLLYVGSENPRKNLPRLIGAFDKIRKEYPDLRLIKVGPQLYLRQARALKEYISQKNLEREVLFFENVTDHELASFYNLADAFVLPSLYEGFGLPPLEAMACGTPVICSYAASLPEVVGDAALLVDPYDVDAIADAVCRILADPNLASDLRCRGLARARQFTWERTARETIAVYEKVLGEKLI